MAAAVSAALTGPGQASMIVPFATTIDAGVTSIAVWNSVDDRRLGREVAAINTGAAMAGSVAGASQIAAAGAKTSVLASASVASATIHQLARNPSAMLTLFWPRRVGGQPPSMPSSTWHTARVCSSSMVGARTVDSTISPSTDSRATGV